MKKAQADMARESVEQGACASLNKSTSVGARYIANRNGGTLLTQLPVNGGVMMCRLLVGIEDPDTPSPENCGLRTGPLAALT